MAFTMRSHTALFKRPFSKKKLPSLCHLLTLRLALCTGDSSSSSSKSGTVSHLPSSLNGPPVSSLCPPGMCQFGSVPIAVPLLERTAVSPTSSVLRFGLPDPHRPLQLSTCACLLATTTLQTSKSDDDSSVEEEVVTRPYTPISTNANKGTFDLLVKHYGPTAKMSHRFQEMHTGDTSVAFSHIPFNVKIPAEELLQQDAILMLAGGTGITPMIQALHAILGSSSSHSKHKPVVTLLYGSQTSEDILGRALLQQWAKDYPDQFRYVDMLSDEPEDSTWPRHLRGYIDAALIQEHFAHSSTDSKVKVMVCGPPPMYHALCGPREDDSVSGVLAELGYGADDVYKF